LIRARRNGRELDFPQKGGARALNVSSCGKVHMKSLLNSHVVHPSVDKSYEEIQIFQEET
jgi:hypothetical protein